MARPNKQGVDYFPLDVHVDDKFKFIEIKYKLEGFAIVVKLLQKIYSCGYWYKWTDDEALLFSDEIRTDFNLVTNVVNECLQRDVFNKEMHEKYNILTSKGIQKRYKEIVRRRKDVDVTEDYLLVDNISLVNDDINPSDIRQDDGKSTQSKGKESKQKKKVNETKENKNKYAEFVSLEESEYQKLITEFGESNTKKMIEVLDNYKGSSGKKYKSDYRAIHSWVKDRVLNETKPNGKKSIFQQGEESKKRQEQIKPLTPEEQERMKKWEEELPY